ncbi:MAG: RepB family plasmid replication initiator protein [Candidatus Electrothrix sp. GM3_4]|nr:RepB family plasmid replication initiator protein [Candidatus Electrothrix sp. GM3_4]
MDPKLRPYLLNLKSNFLSYDLLVAIRFKSSYTIRIFQLLLANHRKHKKKIFTFSLGYLRGLFRLEKNQYPLFANFKARILEPARKELEEKHKDFYFQYNELKE